jgi:hypothetical protein
MQKGAGAVHAGASGRNHESANLGPSALRLDLSQPENLEVATTTIASDGKAPPITMASADFAAAQARLLERRRAREAVEHARRTEQHAVRAAATTRLPFPLRNIGDAGLSVWDAVKGREGTRPAFRVGQVDAELLDEELLELMKGQVGEALKYYGVGCGLGTGPYR